MGLALRDPAYFSSFAHGASCTDRHYTARDADPTVGTADQLDDRNRKLSRHLSRQDSKHQHRDCAPGACRLGRGYQCYRVLASRTRRRHRSRARQLHHRLEARVTPLTSETHHVKPYCPWGAEADEGVTLARSSLLLPGESVNGISNGNSVSQDGSGSQQDRRRARSRSSACTGGLQTRPPSLERQDAFRDEKTAKRHRAPGSYGGYDFDDDDNANDNDGVESDADNAQTAELYRLGLLYDNDYERGAGFSLAYLDHGMPVYSLRVRQVRRPQRRQQHQERQPRGWSSQEGAHSRGESNNDDEIMRDSDDGQGYLVDLAFSAFGENEAFRQWMVPGPLESGLGPSGHGRRSGSRELTQPSAHCAPLLRVVYELTEAPTPSPTADCFLAEDVSVSDVSTCGWADEDDTAWSLLDTVGEVNGAEKGTLVDGDEVDPWVMLDRDGS
ncbi:hypothetical protein VTJ83DRAFT_2800 [Remersonia thermophila]|uniref:Uncharacterized protein n=1 Tax=Remersonia thermophila TaxID=72144 RepID=A0ABR4DJQ3_9PEZI